MSAASNSEIKKLRGPILRSVSRSFYLSLRILPPPLRDPISLAYLLARATDTIADSFELDPELRREALRNLTAAIQGTATREAVAALTNAFARLQGNDAERRLIATLPTTLIWLDLMDERDRIEVRNVLTKINRGQILDLERFGANTGICALNTASELEEYTYLVAGCVGEFWTQICLAHVRNFSDRSQSEMLQLGVEYGKGLQLINVLRDVGADLRAGRCYLPREEFVSLGRASKEVFAEPECLEPIMQRWREKAEHGISAGLKYACAIRSARIRFATALPALIGARTLALLREAGGEAIHKRVKVSRTEVRQITSSTALRLASPRWLNQTFRRLSR